MGCLPIFIALQNIMKCFTLRNYSIYIRCWHNLLSDWPQPRTKYLTVRMNIFDLVHIFPHQKGLVLNANPITKNCQCFARSMFILFLYFMRVNQLMFFIFFSKYFKDQQRSAKHQDPTDHLWDTFPQAKLNYVFPNWKGGRNNMPRHNFFNTQCVKNVTLSWKHNQW